MDSINRSQELPFCSICQDDIENSVTDISTLPPLKMETWSINQLGNGEDDDGLKLKCNHVFHKACISGWINEFKLKTTVPTCPDCRKQISENPAIIIQQGTNLLPNQQVERRINDIMPNIPPLPSNDLPSFFEELNRRNSERNAQELNRLFNRPEDNQHRNEPRNNIINFQSDMNFVIQQSHLAMRSTIENYNQSLNIREQPTTDIREMHEMQMRLNQLSFMYSEHNPNTNEN